MNRLTSEQAQILFECGGFIILTSLPESSEFGIDGTYVPDYSPASLLVACSNNDHPDSFHLTRRFSGVKFLTPGIHLISWSPAAASSTAGQSAIPLRSGLIHVFKPKERIVLSYDKESETVAETLGSGELISDDHLKTLDAELAPYPFEGLDRWKALTRHISQDVVQTVLGPSERVDGMMQAEGEEDVEDGKECRARSATGHQTMRFPQFRLKRSWRDGAIGEEVTRYARDKSWLLGDLISSPLDSRMQTI